MTELSSTITARSPRDRANDPGAWPTPFGGADMAERTCAVDGCERRAAGRGWCPTHYSRWRVTGTTDPRVLPTPEERFRANVTVTNSCWRWTACLDGKGYGVFGVEGRQVRAHRWSYEHFVGPIPEGLDLDHECHNQDLSCAGGVTCQHRACVNPAHLVPRTRRENLRRGRTFVGENLSKTHCPEGHPYGGENLVLYGHSRRCKACTTIRERLRDRDWSNNGKRRESTP